MKSTTKQVKYNNNPTGKGGFGDHPENRNDGSWDKDSTPRFKLEQMMKLSETELTAIIKDKRAPQFERKLAICMLEGGWKVTKEMISEVYGMPTETVKTTANMQVVMHDQARDESVFNKQDE
jgi:hypothetical protein